MDDDLYQEQMEVQAGAQYRQPGVPDEQDEAPQQVAPVTVDDLIQRAHEMGAAQGQSAAPPAQAIPAYDPSQGEDISYSGAPAPDATKHSGLRAFGDEVWASTLGMGQGILGSVSAATRALTGDPSIVAHVENAKQALGDHIAKTMDGLSDDDKRAMASSFFGGKDAQGNDVPVPGTDVGWGTYLKTQAAALVPQIALAVVPGSIVGKAVTKVAGAVLSEDGAALAGTIASRATTAGAFGALDAGQAYNAIIDGVDNATPAQLASSPVYHDLRQQGYSDEDARKGMVSAITPAFVAMHFAVGAVAGAGLGEGLANGIPGAAERGALARFGIGATEGAAVMGSQGAADTALDQGAEQQAGLRQGYDAGAIEKAGVSGALAGAVMGGAAGLFRTHGAMPVIPKDDTGVGEAETAALAQAIPQGGQGGPPDDPPGGAGGAAQQEMFSAKQLAQQPNVGGNRIPPGPNAMPGQAELFGTPATTPPAASADPAQPAGAPGAGVAPSAPGAALPPAPATPAGPVLTSRADFIAAIKALPGDNPKGLAAMKLSDLKDLHADLAAKAQQAAAQTTGPSATTVVDPSQAGGGDVASPPADQPAGTAPAPVVSGSPDTIASGVGPDTQPAQVLGGADPGASPAPSSPAPAEQPQVAQAAVAEAPAEPAPAQTPKEILQQQEAAKPLSPAAARRAANKAAMAPAGPRVKGDAYVEGGESAVPPSIAAKATETAPARTRTQAMGDLRDALDPKDITPIKGVPASQVIRQAMQEISDIVGKSKDLTGKSVTDAVETWGKTNGDKVIPGSKSRRGDVAALISKRLLGDDYEPASSLAADAAREVANAPQAFETATHEKVAVEDENAEPERTEPVAASEELHADEAPAVGGEDTPVSARVENAGNKVQQASELLTQVENGLKTPQEAHEAYGKQAGPGKPRQYPTFASFLERKAQDAEDPAKQAALLARVTKVAELPRAERQAAERELNIDLRRSGPEYAKSLRDMAAQITDPVGHAADAQEARRIQMQAAIDARKGKINDTTRPPLRARAEAPRASSTFVKAARNPELNEFVSHQIERAESRHEPITLHDTLRAIANNQGVRDNMRPLAELAQRLLKVAPDIPVFSPEEAARQGIIDNDQRSRFGDPEGLVGSYQPGYRENGREIPTHIVLSPDQHAHVETLIHEALHSVTEAHITRALDQGGDIPSIKALHAIQDELYRHLDGDTELTERQRFELEYALTDEHETHTMLMSNPTIQDWAARQTASPALRADLSRLGYAPGPEGRSVWRHFTDWVRSTLGMPKVASASEYSLLDHMMRPLTDITDQAAQYNAAMEKYPDVAAKGMPLLRVASTTLGDRGRGLRADLSRAIDTPGMPDKLRATALPLMPTDHITDRYAALFQHADHGNPMLDVRAATERQAAIAKDFRDRRDGVVGALLTRLKGAGGDALGKLTRDATLAGARLGGKDPVADNAHLTTPEQQATLADLQKRYAKLSSADQDTYNGLRDHYSSVESEKRTAMTRAVIDRSFPDVTQQQRDMLTKIASTKRGIDAFLKNPDDPALASMFGTQWETQRGLFKNIVKIQRLGFVQGDYFPLRRFGDYVVTHGEPTDENYAVEMFEKRGDAEARRAELAKQNVAGLSDVKLKRKSYLSEIAPQNPAVDELHAAMAARDGLKDHADEVRNLLQSTLLEHATRSEAARTALRRNSVLGASDDAGRILAREFLSNAGALGAIKAGPDRAEAFARMRMVVKHLEDTRGDGSGIVARQVMNELERRTGTGDDAASAASGLFRKATNMGFVQSLMSWSHMLTSTIETHSNSEALMGARHGAVRTAFMLSKALSDITPTMFKEGAGNTVKAMTKGLKAADWNLSNVARDRLIAKGANSTHMNALFKSLNDAGLIDHSAVREMQRIANPSGYNGTGMGTVWHRFMDLNAAGAHAVDVANKSAVAKAAFDMEYAKNLKNADLSPQQRVAGAVDYATGMVRKVAPNYNLANKARISTDKGALGAFAAPLTQFKQYGLHMYSLMANLAKQSMHGADAASRSEARKAFAGLLATHAMMAGGLTLIADPLRYIGGAYDMVTGAQRPHDYENDVRGFLSDTFGPEAGEVMARGLPHLAGIDIHNRVGLANLLEMPEMDEFSSKGALMALGKLMTGASGEDAANMVGGIAKLGQGDVMGGAQALVPRVLRDPFKADKLATTGVTDSRGHTILTPDQVGTGGVVAQALGFQPAAVSEAREGRAAVQQAEFESKAQTQKLTQAWLAATDPAERAAVMSQINQYNRSGQGAPIQVDALYRALAAQQAQSRVPAGPFGVRLPKGTPANVSQAGRFANY